MQLYFNIYKEMYILYIYWYSLILIVHTHKIPIANIQINLIIYFSRDAHTAHIHNICICMRYIYIYMYELNGSYAVFSHDKMK